MQGHSYTLRQQFKSQPVESCVGNCIPYLPSSATPYNSTKSISVTKLISSHNYNTTPNTNTMYELNNKYGVDNTKS